MLQVYLTWTLPECSAGCPSSWIHDGFCDKACNNSFCDFDGGDCIGDSNTGMVKGDQDMDLSEEFSECNPSCADSWLADSYCDTVSNFNGYIFHYFLNGFFVDLFDFNVWIRRRRLR